MEWRLNITADGSDVGCFGEPVPADADVAEAGMRAGPALVQIWAWSSTKTTSRGPVGGMSTSFASLSRWLNASVIFGEALCGRRS